MYEVKGKIEIENGSHGVQCYYEQWDKILKCTLLTEIRFYLCLPFDEGKHIVLTNILPLPILPQI